MGESSLGWSFTSSLSESDRLRLQNGCCCRAMASGSVYPLLYFNRLPQELWALASIQAKGTVCGTGLNILGKSSWIHPRISTDGSQSCPKPLRICGGLESCAVEIFENITSATVGVNSFYRKREESLSCLDTRGVQVGPPLPAPVDGTSGSVVSSEWTRVASIKPHVRDIDRATSSTSLQEDY